MRFEWAFGGAVSLFLLVGCPDEDTILDPATDAGALYVFHGLGW